MTAYLDHNASTPLDKRVLESMLPYLTAQHGNPSAVYRQGRVARQAIETAREQVAELVNTHPSQVVFTGGGTESNNLAIKGLAASLRSFVVSAVEHASVFGAVKKLVAREYDFLELPVDQDGKFLLGVFQMQLDILERPALVSVMLANNETGVIQDVAILTEMARDRGFVFHTDATQAAGKIPVDFSALGVQMMSLSSHKLYGPKGAGALIVDRHVELVPELIGGGQERGYRGGTENVAAIVGFGAAAELARNELSQRKEHLQMLSNNLEQRLGQIKGATIFASQVERLPNTVFLAIPGIDGEALLMTLDRADIAVSSGSACDSQKSGPSRTLMAMGVDEDLARCAVRVSFGMSNTIADIDRFIAVVKSQLDALRGSTTLAWA